VEFAESFVELNGCRTHLRRAGKGQPLLFLHGASGAPVILPFMRTLAESFDVLVTEHPGYGRSDEPEWLENIHDMAYFYLDFLAHLDLSEVVLKLQTFQNMLQLSFATFSRIVDQTLLDFLR